MTDRPIWDALPPRPVSRREIAACIPPELCGTMSINYIQVTAPGGLDNMDELTEFLVWQGERVQYVKYEEPETSQSDSYEYLSSGGWRKVDSVNDKEESDSENPHAALELLPIEKLGKEIIRVKPHGRFVFEYDKAPVIGGKETYQKHAESEVTGHEAQEIYDALITEREQFTPSSDGVQFTGTVVQTGTTTVLDNGEDTVRVESDEQFSLGEKITVRGEMRDGALVEREIVDDPPLDEVGSISELDSVIGDGSQLFSDPSELIGGGAPDHSAPDFTASSFTSIDLENGSSISVSSPTENDELEKTITNISQLADLGSPTLSWRVDKNL